MKTHLPLLFILMAAFFLTSCGAKKTATTFEVSTSALSVSNSSFPGGLIIMGTNGKESFTYPIPGGSGTVSSVTLELSRQSWTFSAIGFEGASPFSGQSKCGSETVDLNQNEQTVALNISYAKCATQTATFGSNLYRVSNSFIPLKVVTCGWLYTDNVSSPVGASTPLNYCDSSATFDAKYKQWAKSVKIEVLQNVDGVVSPGISQCIATGSDGVFTASMNVPEKGVPFVITLYNQLSCPNDETIISKFDFKEGPGGIYADHDSIFNGFTGDARLFLPSYDTKRGFTSLTKPFPMACAGLPCMGLPSAVPSSKDRIISSGSEFVVLETPGVNQTCDKLNAGFGAVNITPSPTLATLKSNCEMKNGQLILRLNYASLGASPSLNLTFDGGASVLLSFVENTSYNAYRLGWEVLGYPVFPGPVSNVRNSFRAFFDHKEDSGLMSEVRDLMGPEGAGGILGPGLVCSVATATKYVTFIEEGESKTYKIELMNAGALPTVSSYTDDGSAVAGEAFEKKILVSRQVGPSSYDAEMALHFNCGYNIGHFQNRHVRTGKSEKRVVEWNTETPTTARVREIKYEEEKSGALTTKWFSSFRYAESPSDATKVYVRSYNLMINHNGTDYTFSPSTSRLSVSSGLSGFTYVHATPPSNNAAFTDTSFITGLAAEILTPTGFTFSDCFDKTAFAVISPGACTGLPVVLLGSPVYDSWNSNNLRPQLILNFFN
ncbi:MAG: hypothetical protein V4598_10000 [Bdellovibrionota bacterium]